MPKSTEFGERQYEIAFHIELGTGGGTPFIPTQRLERYLAIDAATDARDLHRIWRILNVASPQRLVLTPALWPGLPGRFHRRVPGRVVSLFLQFKVPKHLDGKGAKYRSDFGAPYYEVAFAKRQQKGLADLQARVQARAVVRYASPAFWTRADFEQFAIGRQLLLRSAYIAPSSVGNHKKWFYAGPTGKVICNPDPDQMDGESWESVVVTFDRIAREETLSAHVRALAESIRGMAREAPPRERKDDWLGEIQRYARLSEEDVQYLSDLRVVVDAAEQANTTWLVMVNPNDPARTYFQMLQSEWAWMASHYLW